MDTVRDLRDSLTSLRGIDTVKFLLGLLALLLEALPTYAEDLATHTAHAH